MAAVEAFTAVARTSAAAVGISVASVAAAVRTSAARTSVAVISLAAMLAAGTSPVRVAAGISRVADAILAGLGVSAAVAQVAQFRNAAETAARAPHNAAVELDRQAKEIEAVGEAAAARAEFVLARQERQRVAMADLVTRLTGRSGWASLRPEDVRLGAAGDGELQIEGRLVTRSFMGATIRVAVDVGALRLHANLRPDATVPEDGSAVTLVFARPALHDLDDAA